MVFSSFFSSYSSSSSSSSTTPSEPSPPEIATTTSPTSAFDSTPSTSSSSSLKPRRTFEELVKEELPIQRASVAMEGGMPSCLTLFDRFFLCYSLASQGLSVYRYGTPRDCSAKFDDFKFCMSLKSMTDERKEEMWVTRRAEWWARRRMGKSSEDVWEARRNVYSETPVDIGALLS